MAEDSQPLTWSGQYTLSSSARSHSLPGDKIVLPASALEQLLAAATASSDAESQQPQSAYSPYRPRQADNVINRDRPQPQLPHPLVFRLVNPATSDVVYAGVQEFSADDGHIILSTFLGTALGLLPTHSEPDEQLNETQAITVSTEQLPKGRYVKLRPLEAGYDPEDWKALLEQYLRTNYTTLTAGQVLVIPNRTDGHDYRFLIDTLKPEGHGVCIVDTDLEVDIEALNEEQARDTVSRIVAKTQKHSTADGSASSTGGQITIHKPVAGQVLVGEYVDYQLESWPRSLPLTIRLEPSNDGDESTILRLLISPFSNHQRAQPRISDFVFSTLSATKTQELTIDPGNIELKDADALWVSVWSYKGATAPQETSTPSSFSLQIVAESENDSTNAAITDADTLSDETRCPNCQQLVPKASVLLHESFCRRNNILCSQGCGNVYQKSSSAWQSHWHCPHDTFFGDSKISRTHHDFLFHPPEPLRCDRCSTTQTFSSIPLLAQHHVTVCPAKTILCRFCHLVVPQEGDPDHPSAETLISGLSQHELEDGSRTTECHLCNRVTRLRDLDTHLRHHDLERKSRARPRRCRNAVCGRTQDGTAHNGNTRVSPPPADQTQLGLCSLCFSPLYVSLYDPEGKALLRRIERRYLQQLMTGCGKAWCLNPLCKTGRSVNRAVAPSRLGLPGPETVIAAKDALPLIKPLVSAAAAAELLAGNAEVFFCVDAECQRRGELAALLEVDGAGRGAGAAGAAAGYGYDIAWCLGAIEAEGGDLERARSWLVNWAPRRDEERG